MARSTLRREMPPRFGRILVPLDGSSFGEAALRPAVELSRRRQGEVRLVSVHEPDSFPSSRAVTPGLRRSREEYLARLAGNWPDVRVSTVVREGPTEPEILDEADAWQADLIVMSTHGRGAVSRSWLGSVADACLRNSRVPVLLVRARPSAHTEGDASFRPERLVVPLDGSTLAEGALTWGATLAEIFGATVSLLRVVAPCVCHPVDGACRECPCGEDSQTSASTYLDRVAERLRDRGFTVSSEVIMDHHPAPAIIAHAGGDLLVMATHSRSPMERVLLGSVTDKVVRGTRGHVMAIPEVSAVLEGVVPGDLGRVRNDRPLTTSA